MKVIRLPQNNIDFASCCVALGNFDGVHKGHQKVIKTCMKLAKEQGIPSVVYTFLRHPQAVLKGFRDEITNTDAKTYVLEQLLNPDYLALQDVEGDFLAQTPAQFVTDILKNTLHATTVVVGAHYSFGVKGMGDTELLTKLCVTQGIDVVVLPLMIENDAVLSSTNVREYIIKGDLEKANHILGYPFFVQGTVMHGNHIGNTIGFPTINVLPDDKQLLPVYGVYASLTKIDGIQYVGVSNVGVKPTIGSDKPLIETNLFDVRADFYGKHAKVSLLKLLRPETKFDSVDELKRQIIADTDKAKEYFNLNSLD